jgi:hypothetical protein
MNKLETDYDEWLAGLQFGGAIVLRRYEAIKLRLAKRTWFTPDFMVMLMDGSVEFHEVKGFWEDDARVKMKVATETFPEFRFLAVTRKKGEWKHEDFEP